MWKGAALHRDQVWCLFHIEKTSKIMGQHFTEIYKELYHEKEHEKMVHIQPSCEVLWSIDVE